MDVNVAILDEVHSDYVSRVIMNEVAGFGVRIDRPECGGIEPEGAQQEYSKGEQTHREPWRRARDLRGREEIVLIPSMIRFRVLMHDKPASPHDRPSTALAVVGSEQDLEMGCHKSLAKGLKSDLHVEGSDMHGALHHTNPGGGERGGPRLLQCYVT